MAISLVQLSDTFQVWLNQFNTTVTEVNRLTIQANTANNVANDALPKAGGTMTGDLIINGTKIYASNGTIDML